MSSKIETKIAAAIEAKFKPEIPNDIATFARLATWDLHYGPVTYCEECGAESLDECQCVVKFPGFSEATRAIARWAQANLPGTLYYDPEWDGLMDSEPEGETVEGDEGEEEYVEPEPYYTVERREIIAAVFGSTLAEYL